MTLTRKIQTSSIPQKMNVALYPRAQTRAHPMMNPTTFARFKSILSGAEEALESISERFFFFA